MQLITGFCLNINQRGIRGIVSKWVRGYLESRPQYVQFNAIKSVFQNVTCGVLQDTILVHKLFIPYMSNTCNVSKMLNVVLHADDINIFFKHENIYMMCKTVNFELDELST